MPRRFPIDYPFGPRYIALNGLIFGTLVAGIGLLIGTFMGRFIS